MKKLVKMIIALSVTTMVFVGCGTDSTENSATNENSTVSTTNETAQNNAENINKQEIPLMFFGSTTYGENELKGIEVADKAYIDIDTVGLLYNIPMTYNKDSNQIEVGKADGFNSYTMVSDYSNLPDIAGMFIGVPAYKSIIEGSASYYYTPIDLDYEGFKTQAEEYLLANNFKLLSDSEKTELLNTNDIFYTDRELYNETLDDKYKTNKENEIFELTSDVANNNSGKYIQIIDNGVDRNNMPIIVIRMSN